jgi:pimeloyl-ACP methyl ester carboxylesterase
MTAHPRPLQRIEDCADMPASEPLPASDADPLTQGTHTVDVDGLAQRYHVHGRGPVCLLQPGGPGVHWEPMRMPLVEEHLTMVYVEALGTGESGRLASHPNGYTRQFYADALDRLIDHLGQSRVYLLGHSYGGFVAQRYALDHPDRLTGLILYESAPLTGPEHGAEAAGRIQEFVARNADNPEVPGVIAALQSVGTITDDDQLTLTLRELVPAYFADYWGRQDEFAALRDRLEVSYLSSLGADLVPDVIDDRAALPSLRVPTLVICGRFDVICGVRWAQELHQLIAQSQLEVLEKSGHFGHVEQPDAFAAVLTDFVTATGGGSAH